MKQEHEMPTAYTAEVENQTFAEFVMTCARAFSPLIDLIDQPLTSDTPIEIEPSPYHMDKLTEAKEECRNFCCLNDSEQQDLYRKEMEEIRERHLRRLSKNSLVINRHKQMLDKVHAWTPPSIDHRNLKNFMIEQLTTSMEFETDTATLEDQCFKAEKNPTTPSFNDWYLDKLSGFERTLSYHRHAYEKELKMTEQKNRWIRQLVDSLKQEE
jgi:hypothetical protein